MAASSATLEHVAELGDIQAIAIAAGRRAWRKVSRRHMSESWVELLQLLLPAIATQQANAAAQGSSYVAAELADQGTWVAPEAFANSEQLAGWAPDGRTLQGLLYSPAATALGLIGGGMSSLQAVETAGKSLDQILTTLVADTSRQAASIDLGTREGVGWVRMVNPPCCSRCAILAGRFYRWNQGFLRHPKCDCVHVPSTAKSLRGARTEGLIQDPYEYFRSLSAAEQDQIFTKAGAQAIRDGADMSRVVNARRGMTENGMFTTEGMGRRGFARRNLGPRQRRLTPEAIYKLNPNRADALAELEKHGYILPGGQNPLGAIKGANYEGYGELGRGGTRVAARSAVVQARVTGVRAGDRYTMTAAERRLADAQTQWKAVLEGRNPFGRTPLTPQIAATVEGNYRRQLLTGGEASTRTEAVASKAESITVRAGGAGSGGGKPPAPTPAGSPFDEHGMTPREDPATWGKVTVPDGMWPRPEQHELDTAGRLAILGFDVDFRHISSDAGVKNPDIVMDGDVWELKAPSGAGKNTVWHQISRARKQAGRLVLDTRRTALDDTQILAEIRRRFAADARLDEVLVLLKDGGAVRITRR